MYDNSRNGKFFLHIIIFSFILNLKTIYAEEVIQYIPINKDVHGFIQQMEKDDHFNPQRLAYLMKHSEYLPSVIESVKKPFEKKPWDNYRDYFVSEKYIRPGIIYWRKHEKILNDIQKKYGVNSSIIVAMIGIESYYGMIPGKYQEIGALSTLAFFYPPRSAFFKNELKEYLILSREENLQTLKITGSYAGAIGIPQFMPSNYLRYGVGFSKSGKINLVSNHADAIASIANYLKRAGWETGAPIAIPALTPTKIDNQFLSNHAVPQFSLQDLALHHIYPKVKLNSQDKVALIELNKTDSNEYWITFSNFHAIMRYKPSTHYALAVYELRRAIQKEYEQKPN